MLAIYQCAMYVAYVVVLVGITKRSQLSHSLLFTYLAAGSLQHYPHPLIVYLLRMHMHARWKHVSIATQALHITHAPAVHHLQGCVKWVQSISVPSYTWSGGLDIPPSVLLWPAAEYVHPYLCTFTTHVLCMWRILVWVDRCYKYMPCMIHGWVGWIGWMDIHTLTTARCQMLALCFQNIPIYASARLLTWTHPPLPYGLHIYAAMPVLIPHSTTHALCTYYRRLILSLVQSVVNTSSMLVFLTLSMGIPAFLHRMFGGVMSFRPSTPPP